MFKLSEATGSLLCKKTGAFNEDDSAPTPLNVPPMKLSIQKYIQYQYVDVYIYICLYIYLCIYIYTYIVHRYICIYTYIHVYAFTLDTWSPNVPLTRVLWSLRGGI